MAMAGALTAAGPGRCSLDCAFGIRLPGVIVAGTLITAAALLGLGLAGQSAGAPGRQEQAGAQAPAGREATASGSTQGRL
jgi:hypothetical protein